MYGKELFCKGVYGIKDLANGNIVYVGSTNNSFVTRWKGHISQMEHDSHYNKRLSELFKTGEYEFAIFEVIDTSIKELLEREKYYSELHKVVENGYAFHVGGGTLQPVSEGGHPIYKDIFNIETIRSYIIDNWYNKKIFQDDKAVIEQYLSDNKISVGKFMVGLKKLGFVTQRFSDKKSWLITGKTF